MDIHLRDNISIIVPFINIKENFIYHTNNIEVIKGRQEGRKPEGFHIETTRLQYETIIQVKSLFKNKVLRCNVIIRQTYFRQQQVHLSVGLSPGMVPTTATAFVGLAKR